MPRRARAIARDRRLFYENILRNAPLDFNNKEIQDIQTAVRQMLERVTVQINTEPESPFKISYIQPCGSMEEKSSILKAVKRPYDHNGERLTKYIEFDYLAIIDKPDDVRLEGSCPACRFGPKSILKPSLRTCVRNKVELVPLAWEDVLKQGNEFPLRDGSDDVFYSQLGRSVASLCSCFSLVFHRDNRPDLPTAFSLMCLGVKESYLSREFSFEPANTNINGCPSCTVTMDTGCLTVMPKVINDDHGCSLILLWTSYVSSLSDFDCYDTLQTTKQIKYLPIHIDFIPARKISGQQINGSNPLFLVPKRCSYCDRRCRLSDCLGEIEYFLNNVSEKHKKAYLIIKFIFQFIWWPPKYHLKVILFQHCKICTDTSEDYTTCVLRILRELLQSYENGVLMAFSGNVNLLKGIRKKDWHDERSELNSIIKRLSNFKTWTRILYAEW